MSWLKIAVLGKGSHATVFLAESTSPQNHSAKLIAIKSSPHHLADSLLKEEAILQALRGCPEIIGCYGSQITKEDGISTYNLLLEYAPHDTLFDLITTNGFLWENEARIYTRMILKGLSFMHKKGFVHCDLKSENILLFPSFQEDIRFRSTYKVKIADFGLSRTKEEEIDTRLWKFRYRGTPYFMSPESIELGLIEAPLDIWSLGCIIMEMVTGLNPWDSIPDLRTFMHTLIVEKHVPEIPNRLSKDCQDFLNKCFLRDPSERWTADMLLNHPFVQF